MPRDTPLTFSFQSPAEALAALLSQIQPVETESIPLDQSPGRILAQAITADRASPAVDVSSMDGYAVRLADLATAELPIVGEVRIGREPPVLPAGACVRIVTGGAIPSGADAVIKREDVAEHPDRITLPRATRIQSGQNIRRAAENLVSGATVARGGQPITPVVAAALATFGVAMPTVFRRVRLAVLTTGDEVVPPHASPSPWQLRDSNASTLRAMFQPLPFVELWHHHIPDDAGAMRAAVESSLATSDALMLTGGVSMGHRDYVADALEQAGVRTVFHGLPQKPGKPVLAGIAPGRRPVLALPGNPVSVVVTARRLAVPAIFARAGCQGSTALRASASHVVTLTNPDGVTIPLWHHRPVRLTTHGQAELLGSRSSGDVPGAANTDGFVEVPPGQQGPGPWPFYSWGP